ncbi:MAG: hypothetical protein RBU29_16625, partial [bacterium]|nr:hypothetical protein [bacterium]
PFADYRDHVHVGQVVIEDTVHWIILSGAEESLLFGVGAFLRNIQFYTQSLSYRQPAVAQRPLTPLRGFLFTNTASHPSYFLSSEEEWDIRLMEAALQGTNVVGIVPALPRDWTLSPTRSVPQWLAKAEMEKAWQTHWETQRMICQRAKELGMRVVLYLPQGAVDILEASQGEGWWHDLPVGSIYLFASVEALFPFYAASGMPGPLFLEELKRWMGKPGFKDGNEVWVSSSGFHPEDLSGMMDWLVESTHPVVKALTSGPEVGREALLMREMPLMTQLVTLSPLSRAVRIPQPFALGPERCFVYGEDLPLFLTEPLARRYYELAPLTYGALGVSSGAHDAFQRFLWSQISWDPQPAKEEIMERFGNYWFGAESAGAVCGALLLLESVLHQPAAFAQAGAESALAKIEEAMNLVPPRRKSLARPAYFLLKYRILCEIALACRIRHDSQTKAELATLLADAELEPEAMWQRALAVAQAAPTQTDLQSWLNTLEETEQWFLNEWGYSPGSADALRHPLAGLGWVQRRLAMLEGGAGESLAAGLALIRCRIERELGLRDFLIDCGNGETDTFRESGFGYALERIRGSEPVTQWMIALSERAGEPVDYTIPLPSLSPLTLEIRFHAPYCTALQQTVYCGEHVLDPLVMIQPGKKEKRKYTIGVEQRMDGPLHLSLRPPEDAFAGVCEILAEIG